MEDVNNAPTRAKDHPRAVRVRFTVDTHLSGARADLFLGQKIKRLSRTRAQRIIEQGDVERANGLPLRASSRLQSLEVLHLWRVPPDEEPTLVSIPVLFEDDHLLVIHKPPDMAVHPSARYYSSTLTQILRRRGYPLSTHPDAVRVPRPAHRLDRETSGVLVCARTAAAERIWKDRFLKGQADKTYLALCVGEPAWDRIILDLPLGFLTGLSVAIKVGHVETGQTARTDVDVLWRGNGRSLLRCQPRTGRTHQIRAHLAMAGFPVVGDKLYGPGQEEWFARYQDEGLTPELEDALDHSRHALHAAILQAGQDRFVAGWPADLAALEPEAARVADAFLGEAGRPLWTWEPGPPQAVGVVDEELDGAPEDEG